MDKLNRIPKREDINNILDELQKQFLEMGQLKSDFDIEKYTVMREGKFVAHQFHMMMRQYHLALGELRRLLIRREENQRWVKKLKKIMDAKVEMVEVVGEFGPEMKYVDLEIARRENEMFEDEITLVNKVASINYYEKVRKELVKRNGGKAPTNAQHQAEEPEYWRWFLERKAVWQTKQRHTGISEGIWENIDFLEEPVVIQKQFQVQMLDEKGLLNLDEVDKRIESYKKRKERLLNGG